MSDYRKRLEVELRGTGAVAGVIDQRIGYSAGMEALEEAKEQMLLMGWGCSYQVRNRECFQKVCAALAVARGQQMGNMGNEPSSCDHENATVQSPGSTPENALKTLPHCPECGYTREDSAMWLDHDRCKGKIPDQVTSPGSTPSSEPSMETRQEASREQV